MLTVWMIISQAYLARKTTFHLVIMVTTTINSITTQQRTPHITDNAIPTWKKYVYISICYPMFRTITSNMQRMNQRDSGKHTRALTHARDQLTACSVLKMIWGQSVLKPQGIKDSTVWCLKLNVKIMSWLEKLA